MNRPSICTTVLLLSLLLSLPALKSQARSVFLFDQEYAYRKTGQRDWVQRRVHKILWPTIITPALVSHGGRFSLLLRPGSRLSKNALELQRKSAWRVRLRRRGQAPDYPCALQGLKLEKGYLRLDVLVPAKLARDVYDLSVMGPGTDDRQPNALRILGADQEESFRFALLTDHQLWDPTSQLRGRQLNAGGYPRQGEGTDNLAMAHQGLAEVALHDPDFVLYLGDLVFGVNYPQEYDQAYHLLQKHRLPIFAVPGNHDGYANYVVKLRGGALDLLAGAWTCRRHLAGNVSWDKAWQVISCIYGDVKQQMYADLHRDGLVYWRRQLGPTTYAFERGQLRFVGLNTYDGTPQRRHAFSIYADAWDLHIGAPAVDNYGGYLSEAQLRFVKRQARLAGDLQQTLVVFGHHDPRGNHEGQRYHPNDPFPTSPIGLGGFEEWNYDSATWDSDPADHRRGETPTSNSGLALLEILARHGGYYLFGHGHRDQRTVYTPGSTLAGFTVQRRLEFIRTTTAASSVLADDGYWGYRLLEVDGGRLRVVDYAPEHGLGSLPAGNLWAALEQSPDKNEMTVSSGLPRETRVTVRWDLPTLERGYRFKLRPHDPDDKINGRFALEQPRVQQVMAAGQKTTYWIGIRLPGAAFPPLPTRQVKQRLRAIEARGNEAPEGVIDVLAADGLQLQHRGAAFDAVVGQPLLLSAERSRDAQGDRIVAFLWQLGDERDARGERIAHRFVSPGKRTLRLTLVDEAGAMSTVTRTIDIQVPRPPGCGGCCAGQQGVAGVVPFLFVVMGLAIGGMMRRRRRR